MNFTLIPEVPFGLDGRGGFLAALKQRILERGHAVVVVAEGAGQDIFQTHSHATDASGNIKLQDIGSFLTKAIEAFFAAERVPITLRYFDPGYQIRSRPANCEDAVLCDQFARQAVHAALAGKTGLVVGFLHGVFIHVPTELIVSGVINRSISSCSFLLTGNPCANCKTTQKKSALSTKIIAQIYRLTVHLLMD